MAERILIIDDDRELTQMVQMDLQEHGYDTLVSYDGLEGLRQFHAAKPDLVMLDIALPNMDGRTVCQRIRELSDVPILMMTAHAISEEDIVAGLNVGADEYLIKPLRSLELQARIKALLRRARFTDTDHSLPTGYHDEFLSVDVPLRRVIVNGQEVRLTPTEFKLLSLLVQHPGEVLTFQQLLEQVWGYEYNNENHYPRIYVSHLRKKVEPDAKNPTYIQSEYGIGYRFVKKV
ncbi:response regulator transcription factor [Anaerolineae bacterium CFX9]|jgi:DNA-binding response OmpR family regulator|nr:response regulator transcription factor [Anaerolineae bacterium CFX9]